MNAQQFRDTMAATANALDLEQHMNLVSNDVSVFGVPGFDDWFNPCKHEFENRPLKQVSYEGLDALAETPDKIMFESVETVEGVDGTVNTHGIEFIIQKEDDGNWRVRQERLFPEDELESDMRRGAL
jgi:ketosteroid isomerase-like protein